MNEQPYISFVVVARNDNYGVDFLGRLQNFIDVLLSLWEKYNLNAELIIVEWNPPDNTSPLINVIKLPGSAIGKVRIITVPNEIHRTISDYEKYPVFEYIGKNVGIRRAKGKYTVATNPDLIYSKELIKFLANTKLSDESFYRIDRFDFNGPIPNNLSIEKKIRFAQQNVFKIETLGGTIHINTESMLPYWLKFFLGYKKYNSEKKKTESNRIEDRIHTNASGDFFLMSKENWLKVKGYPELHTNTHIDAYLCCIALSQGLKQEILTDPKKILHQEHNRSARPTIAYEEWVKQCTEILNNKKPLTDNENWGLDGRNLQEQYGKH